MIRIFSHTIDGCNARIRWWRTRLYSASHRSRPFQSWLSSNSRGRRHDIPSSPRQPLEQKFQNLLVSRFLKMKNRDFLVFIMKEFRFKAQLPFFFQSSHLLRTFRFFLHFYNNSPCAIQIFLRVGDSRERTLKPGENKQTKTSWKVGTNALFFATSFLLD